MLLGTLDGSLLTGIDMYRAGFDNNKCNCGQGMYRAGKGMYRAGLKGIKKNH